MTKEECKANLKSIKATGMECIDYAIECIEKLERIEQIINEKHYSVKSVKYEIKEVLEQW